MLTALTKTAFELQNEHYEDRDNRWYEIAYKKAHSSVFSKKNFRMCALAVRGGAIIGLATNGKIGHAERRCLRPKYDWSGATVYVARVNRRCSKPCPKCMDVLIKEGVRSVVYVNNENRLVEEFL